jgi:hypothetical protein
MDKYTARRDYFKNDDEFHYFLSHVLVKVNGKAMGDCNDEDLEDIDEVTIVVDPYDTEDKYGQKINLED